MTKEFPNKYEPETVESRWAQSWVEQKLYSWKPRNREETFVIDTPPPTVSGSLHLGHVFGYTQADCIARYQRMRGKSLCYPMGWDDNGLPTERRVQNYFAISCNPDVPYKENWVPKHHEGKNVEVEEVSRQNFIEACDLLTKEDEKVFKQIWTRLGLSVDWDLEYATIDEHCRKVSQLSFLDLLKKGQAYNSEAPTMWDIDFQSAIAQAELEDRERPGAFHDITFAVEGSSETFVISTTRPELLPACIAVVAHPDDTRYQHLFGKKAITPLFHAPVPIEAADHADPEKGSGILMVCTFGDLKDVEWWKQSGLPLKQIIGRDGRMLDVKFGSEPFVSLNPELANTNYQEIKGLYLNKAQKRLVELLAEESSAVDGKSAALVGEPKPITHPVKFFEKGDRPIEFVPTRQWYIKLLEHKAALLEQGRKVEWYPSHMRSRYEHWVEGLNQDWCYSRQRFFGVPFPVWYRLDENGEPDYKNPICPTPETLPIDPQSDRPEGYREEQRGQPGGFIGDPDVMDTWSTSSVTPQILSHWEIDPKRHESLFPMDLRPQGHDIIRTWAFTTIAKAYLHENKIPWKNITLNGWVLDPDRKKMSKSKGNVVTPEGLLDTYSSDAVRYWASRARMGTDTALDESVFKIGKKLTTKLFNASKFVIMQLKQAGLDPKRIEPSHICVDTDLSLLAELHLLIEEGTDAYENFNYSLALQKTEEFFWNFCDHYLELVKARSYSEEQSAERDSALHTLGLSLKVLLRMFAPSLPFITEEIWSGSFSEGESIHVSSWPEVEELSGTSSDVSPKLFRTVIQVLGDIRGAKTRAQKSLKWPVQKAVIWCTAEEQALLKRGQDDLSRATNCSLTAMEFRDSAESEQLRVEVELSETNEAV